MEELLKAYLPSMLLFVVLCIMLWKNSVNTKNILDYYGNQLEAEKASRLLMQRRSDEIISDKEETIKELNMRFYSLITQMPSMRVTHAGGNGQSKEPVATEEEMEPMMADATMSASEYPDGS